MGFSIGFGYGSMPSTIPPQFTHGVENSSSWHPFHPPYWLPVRWHHELWHQSEQNVTESMRSPLVSLMKW